MAPDLNSLPPSRSPSATSSSAAPRNMSTVTTSSFETLRGQTPSPSSRTASTSLQAAAAVNAGLQQEDLTRRRSSISSPTARTRQSPHSGRRRSAVLMNIQLNDPTQPAPGEMINENAVSSYRSPSISSPSGIAMGDPHHGRQASLGELHQELEQEQEAHVNRLLAAIRQQQVHIEQLQAQLNGASPTLLAIDDNIPQVSDVAQTHPQSVTSPTASNPRSPALPHPRTSFDQARADLNRRSRTPSRTASPRVRTSSITAVDHVEPFAAPGSSRDESAFYQAEAHMITVENQMLKQRIRELERQVADSHANSSNTHEPATPSNLTRSESVSDRQVQTSSIVPVTTISPEADSPRPANE